ncbi:MAG: FAD-dependent thymidylate synthase [Proteobacteria bacterium]|nr:FAD-dependent thymidylate synthase [Desulfobulbaceae bacterium]MBU4154245.1 FAD-dependent thymidylate synthase [Pseudomonadota bacterium]MDP2105737.1 FAD-dependent thymidylate synthase [Desulfobulbaceae bacterium]
MRIIPQSFEILTALDQGSMASRLEACGRICYKSEAKMTPESAEPFIRNIVKSGHNSVTEMAVCTIKVTIDARSMMERFFESLPKFLTVTILGKNVLLITGSVRAFRELYISYPTMKLVKGMTKFLADRWPIFFFDLAPKNGWSHQAGVLVEKLSLAEVDQLSADLLANHRYVAVKLITNRAVTHEIVRHRPCSFLQESQRYCRYDKEQFGGEVTFIKPMFFKEGSPEYTLWAQAMAETESLYLRLLETSSPQAARTVLPNSCKTEIIVFANLTEWRHIFRLRTSTAAEPSMREIMIPLLTEFKKMYPSVFGGVGE